jgi:hypothetical protein
MAVSGSVDLDLQQMSLLDFDDGEVEDLGVDDMKKDNGKGNLLDFDYVAVEVTEGGIDERSAKGIQNTVIEANNNAIPADMMSKSESKAPVRRERGGVQDHNMDQKARGI